MSLRDGRWMSKPSRRALRIPWTTRTVVFSSEWMKRLGISCGNSCGISSTGTPRTISSKATEENKFRRNTRNPKQNKGELKNDPKTEENQKKLEKSRRTRKSYRTKKGKQKKKLQKAKNKFKGAKRIPFLGRKKKALPPRVFP